MTFQLLAQTSLLWSGEKQGFTLNGKKVLLVNVEDRFYAYEDRCAHQAVELSKGTLEGHILTCRAHDWSYDARTGEGINPHRIKLKRYPLKIVNNDIFIDLEGVIQDE